MLWTSSKMTFYSKQLNRTQFWVSDYGKLCKPFLLLVVLGLVFCCFYSNYTTCVYILILSPKQSVGILVYIWWIVLFPSIHPTIRFKHPSMFIHLSIHSSFLHPSLHPTILCIYVVYYTLLSMQPSCQVLSWVRHIKNLKSKIQYNYDYNNYDSYIYLICRLSVAI